MDSPRLKTEDWLYGLAFLIALLFRMIQLGAAPLTDSEARLALQAFHVAQGAKPLLDPQPAYILLTTIFFSIIKVSNFWARFIPAIVGSALVFFPYFFKERANSRAALILAFLIAVDPGFAALSRQANANLLAVAFTLFAWAMWWNKKYPLAGIFGGLALLSGPTLWMGLLGLAITWLIRQATEPKPENGKPSISKDDLRVTLIYGFISFALIGSLFFIAPNGISASLASISQYFKGWVTPSGVPASRILIALVAYDPLFLVIGLVAIARGLMLKSRRTARLSIWLGVALFLAFVYPARQVADLIWVLIPLLMLATLEMGYSIDIDSEERVEVIATTLSIIILLVFSWLEFSALVLNTSTGNTTVTLFNRSIATPSAPFLFLGGVVALVIVCLVLVSFGWSTRTARLGAMWSLTIFLGIYTLGASWSAGGLRYPSGVELWIPDSRPVESDLLLATANDLSDWSTGHIDSQPVTIVGINSPALEWTLRNYEVQNVMALDPNSTPPFVITDFNTQQLGLTAGYRGQKFTWRQQPIWDAMEATNWLTWALFRKMPQQPETIIFWARVDLFPDGKPQTP